MKTQTELNKIEWLKNFVEVEDAKRFNINNVTIHRN